MSDPCGRCWTYDCSKECPDTKEHCEIARPFSLGQTRIHGSIPSSIGQLSCRSKIRSMYVPVFFCKPLAFSRFVFGAHAALSCGLFQLQRFITLPSFFDRCACIPLWCAREETSLIIGSRATFQRRYKCWTPLKPCTSACSFPGVWLPWCVKRLSRSFCGAARVVSGRAANLPKIFWMVHFLRLSAASANSSLSTLLETDCLGVYQASSAISWI